TRHEHSPIDNLRSVLCRYLDLTPTDKTVSFLPWWHAARIRPFDARFEDRGVSHRETLLVFAKRRVSRGACGSKLASSPGAQQVRLRAVGDPGSRRPRCRAQRYLQR